MLHLVVGNYLTIEFTKESYSVEIPTAKSTVTLTMTLRCAPPKSGCSTQSMKSGKDIVIQKQSSHGLYLSS